MIERLYIINKNTLESLEETDVVKIIEKFTKTGMEVLSADFGFMFWKLEKRNVFQLAYVSPETPYTPKLPRKKGYNYKASKGRIPYFITNPKRDLLPFMKSFVIIPIFYKNHQYGNIVLCFNKNRVFRPEEKPLIMTLSNSAAQALTIHRSHKKAERDFLGQLKQKDEFFNIVSHELKTPVTTIKGYSQLLDQTLASEDKKTKTILEKINNQADKLSRLINDMLNVSHIETGKLMFQNNNFELEKLMRDVINYLKVSIKTHPITFKSFSKFWVHGDEHRIERVIINLVNNAVKYSPPGTKIKICLSQKNDMACVEVEDFGYGISEKDKEKIFNRFYRSKSSNKENLSGLGLGLYISSSIVKHYGGTIGFESKKNSPGTIFYFTLPYYKCKKN